MMANIEIKSGLIIQYTDLNSTSNNTVLMLHGLGATSESWQLQFDPLINSGFRVLAPDLRGFGYSTFPGGENNPGIMASDMIVLLNELSINTCHIIGISMGGAVALEIAVSKPLIVDSLILTNTFSKIRATSFSALFFYAIRLFLVHTIGLSKQADYVANRLFPDDKHTFLRNEFRSQVEKANPFGYRSIMRSFVKFDLSSQMRMIHAPTLIITGENDSVVPPAIQIELASQIPHAEHVFIPDAGHAVSVEQPNEYNRIILNFLANIKDAINPSSLNQKMEEPFHA